MLSFFEYLQQFNESSERSAPRTYMMATGPKQMVLITAFRHEYPLAQNILRNSQLAKDLRDKDYGFKMVYGGYGEEVKDTKTGEPTGEKIDVTEDTFMAHPIKDKPDTVFREEILELIRKYDQDAALIKYQGSPSGYFLDQSGQESSAGKFVPDQAAQYFTQMRKGPSPLKKFTYD